MSAATSDVDQLITFGFDKQKAEMAVKKAGNLNDALTWLEKNADKTVEELQQEEADNETEESQQAAIKGLEEGQLAKSLVCDVCGKKFRSKAQAEFHAGKTDHDQFSESTDEIAPLTDAEKAAKLDEMRAKLAEKRANQAVIDKEEAKRNEQIRQKSTRETQDAKEELARKEQIKEAAKKRQEKIDDIEAKRKIKAKIEADKEERRRKAEEAKAAREGKSSPQVAAGPVGSARPAAPKSSASYVEARLRLQTGGGNVQKTFPAETTLFEVAQSLEAEGTSVSSFTMTFPRKTFESGVDFGQTLREVGLVPSGVLIVK